MEKSKDRENRFRDKGTRKHKAETQKLTFLSVRSNEVIALRGLLVGRPCFMDRREATVQYS